MRKLMNIRLQTCVCTALFGGLVLAVSASEDEPPVQTLEVTSTAYTLREAETKKGNIGLAAWGDQLKPGMKAIAVSRDLIDSGLDHGTKVQIEGLDGTYIVRDKMNKRWEEKIDIFMGRDLEAAREWGNRTVTIRWQAEKDD